MQEKEIKTPIIKIVKKLDKDGDTDSSYIDSSSDEEAN